MAKVERQIPRDPGVTMHFTSLRHYQDFTNHAAFQRAARIVNDLIGAAGEEKLRLVAGHLRGAWEPNAVSIAGVDDPSPRDVLDHDAVRRALLTFFTFGE